LTTRRYIPEDSKLHYFVSISDFPIPCYISSPCYR
jgi:hypothetical protein